MHPTQRNNYWDNNGEISYENRFSYNPNYRPSAVQNGSNKLPGSKYINDPATQPLRMSNNSSSVPKSLQTSSDTSKNGVLKTCQNQITVTRVIGLIIGMIIAGIPLAVMITLYLQPVTTTAKTATTTNPSGVTSSVTNTLPYQCTTHTIVSDSTRTITYTSCLTCYCDTSGFNTWYRFTGAPGTRLWISPPSSNACAAWYTGWFNGTLPSSVGATSIGTGCVNVNGALCQTSYSVPAVLATNCGSFYVFYLPPFPYCYTRFCVM